MPTHCGVLSVTVDDQLWLATPPLGDHDPPPGRDDHETAGVLVTTRRGHAVFEGDGGQRADFRLAPPGAADPNAGCE